MPVPRAPKAFDGDDRRSVLRTFLGAGAVAALAGPAMPSAAYAATGRSGTARTAQPKPERDGRVREYWVQAESFEHNAVPNGYDGMMGQHFTGRQTTYWAIGFRAYSPGWGRPLDADKGPDGIGANQGIPGPVLRGEVGDVIKVHFRNLDHHYRWPHSIHPHGVVYDPDNDGGWLASEPHRPGTAVPYQGTYTYTWFCDETSVGTWPYHDHSVPQTIGRQAGDPPMVSGAQGQAGDLRAEAAASGHAPALPVMEIGAELGLFGVLAITDQDTPAVDREFVVFLHDLFPTDVPSLAQHLNLFNGGAYLDNTPTFRARVGERVRWRIATLGRDLHVFHVHGHRWRSGGRYVDSEMIAPSTTLTLEYTEDNPGNWIYHCHITDHMMGGMVGRYLVEP